VKNAYFILLIKLVPVLATVILMTSIQSLHALSALQFSYLTESRIELRPQIPAGIMLFHPTYHSIFLNIAFNVLGPLNKGVYVLMTGLDLERLGGAAGPIG